MNANRLFRAILVLGLAALAACDGGIGAAPAQFAPAGGDPYPSLRAESAHPVCAIRARPGEMRCYAWIRTDLHLIAPAGGGIPAGAGYGPKDIAQAYRLDQSRGVGQTVAIVDAFGYAQAASDLAYYRRAAGLPPCTLTSGCLRIVNQNGATSPLPKPPGAGAQDWRFEQALDLDAVSATCPKCKLILVQADHPNHTDLGIAAHTAGAILGADVISNSYGEPESRDATRDYSVPGHLYVAAALDLGGGTKIGGGPITPCMYATVVCVGGTNLQHDDGSARGWKEGVYNDFISNNCGDRCGATGSGCSKIIPKPIFQTDKGCAMRSGTDVSADASIFTPLAVYSVLLKSTQNPTGWGGGAGTSLATPIIAGVFALAGNAATRHGARELWQSGSGFNDITTGSNLDPSVTGPCSSSVVYICKARAGYDGPTGWGSPRGLAAF